MKEKNNYLKTLYLQIFVGKKLDKRIWDTLKLNWNEYVEFINMSKERVNSEVILNMMYFLNLKFIEKYSFNFSSLKSFSLIKKISCVLANVLPLLKHVFLRLPLYSNRNCILRHLADFFL